ncbi:hypothetical protein Tco_0981822 [Tanacetum coccineum]
MVLSEMKLDFKKWETILSENVISLSGNKDHPNVCLIYMLYCLANQKPFNLAYYIANRMESVIKSELMVLPYGMLLTRLYRHERAKRIMIDGKRPHPQTSLGSSSSPSPTQTQGEVDLVDNFTLDPVVYCDKLPPITGRASEEFKQTKGMFKYFGHFLSNLGKKK